MEYFWIYGAFRGNVQIRSPNPNGLFYGSWISMEGLQRFGRRLRIVLAVFSHNISTHMGAPRQQVAARQVERGPSYIEGPSWLSLCFSRESRLSGVNQLHALYCTVCTTQSGPLSVQCGTVYHLYLESSRTQPIDRRATPTTSHHT